MAEKPVILLVDDDPQFLDLYTLRLNQAGFQVLQAKNGKEGLELAKSQKPDLILLDVLMPVMDGAETLVALKGEETTKNIPILILTGLEDSAEDIKFAQESGAVDFINKTVDFKDLLKKIKEILKL
jgi:DNA-binding response OmpR family regulator